MKRFVTFLLIVASVILFVEKDAIVEPVSEPLSDIQNQSGRELWVFTAPWCTPCQEYEKTLKIAEANGVKIRRINVDKHPELVDEYDIKVYPTTLVMEDGEEEDREEGAVPLAKLYQIVRASIQKFIRAVVNLLFVI